VIAIVVTGIVFHLTLSDLQELTGWNARRFPGVRPAPG